MWPVRSLSPSAELLVPHGVEIHCVLQWRPQPQADAVPAPSPASSPTLVGCTGFCSDVGFLACFVWNLWSSSLVSVLLCPVNFSTTAGPCVGLPAVCRAARQIPFHVPQWDYPPIGGCDDKRTRHAVCVV